MFTLIICAVFVSQNQVSAEGLRLLDSVWVTRFQDDVGGVQDVIITINGDSGSYKFIGSTAVGHLVNIKYRSSMQHPVGPPTAAIEGDWQFQNKVGYFVFRQPDAFGFMDGYWGKFQGGRPTKVLGSWDGRLLACKPSPAPNEIRPLIPPRPDLPDQKPELRPGEMGLVDLDQLPRPERQIGVNGNITLRSLEKGYKLAESVGRLVFSEKGFYATADKDGDEVVVEAPPGQGAGTCFVIGEGVVMTAKHVIKPVRDYKTLIVTFPDLSDVNNDAERVRRFRIAEAPVLLDPDIAVFRLKPDGHRWPAPFKLAAAIDGAVGHMRFAVGQEVFVLHYPGNEGFSFSIKGLNTIVGADQFLLGYTLSTLPGSSGAPVVNPNWELLAVHYGDGGRRQNIGYRIDLIVNILRMNLPGRPGGITLLKEIGLQ